MTEPPKRRKARVTKRRVAPGLWQLNTDLYEIRVRGVCPHSGKMRSRWRRFEGSKLGALAERERLHAELAGGVTSEPPQRETLEAFAHSWLSTQLARGDWRETTAQRYAQSLELHIVPSLGSLYVDAITPRDVETAVTDWAKRYKRATVNSWLRVLRTVLSAAVAQSVVASNAAASVRALRERRDDDGDETDWANSLTPPELGAYLRSWRELYPEHVALIATFVLTGLRWGEATALMWADIEAAEKNGVIHIRRSHVRGVIRNTTKTGRRRLVPLPIELGKVLGEHRRALLAAQHPGLVAGWVFANDAGKPRANGSLCYVNQRVLAHAKITKRVTLHGLRRTATDLLRRAAVDPVAAKAITGHTTDRMREHYSTVSADETRDVGARVAALVPAAFAPRGG